jgi:vacuolar protein sorting-associated protein 54
MFTPLLDMHRKTMDRLRNGLADKSLDIVSLHRRQKRIAELHEVVTMIEEVKYAESAVEALVQCEDYPSALDLIERSQTTLREHLKGIHGLSTLSDKLHGYRGLIASQISQRFISIVTSPEWMFDEDDSKPAAHSRTRSQSTESTGESSTAELRRLTEVLFRLDALTDVVGQYRDQLTDEIKVVVKTVVTETIAMSGSSKTSSGNGSDSGGADSKVSIQLRALTSDEFLQCVKMIFEHLLMVLERAVVVQKMLTKAMTKKIHDAEADETKLAAQRSSSSDATSNGQISGDGWSPSESVGDENAVLGDWKKKTNCNKIIQEIDDVVRKTCEFSQRSVSNLFAVRKEVQAVYTMPQLRLLYDTTMEFVTNIEKLTAKTDYTLRGALFSQLKLFLEKYHQAHMAKIVSTLDHELWKNTEISVARHKALEDLSSGRGVSLTLSDDRQVVGDTSAPLKAVSVCGKTFRVVWSVLLMLEIVMNYMSCAANFPVLATDVLQRSIEIFRLFNSRTTQLVLGAGAMQIARLKSISARHLGTHFVLPHSLWLSSRLTLCVVLKALASQSLDLTMTLIPHIKAALAAHFTDRQKLLLEEFDRVLRDYAEHNEKIFSKFTSIVEDQIMKRYLENVHAEVRPMIPHTDEGDLIHSLLFLKVDYDANVSVPTNAMRGIKDSTLKLHGVLHPVLSGPQMKDVMTRVFDMFTQKLPECFKQVQPRTVAGKRRYVLTY